MGKVRPKKSLGQHFLQDKGVARRIARSLTGEGYTSVLEVGPGMGVLTGYIAERGFEDFRVVEIDNESVEYLRTSFPALRIINDDFLDLDLDSLFIDKIAVVGNFPYNISSQIFFKVLENREKVAEVCGMLQREVAERICAGPGSRTYGILSVLIQAFYSAQYLFTVPPGVFYPMPKVYSGVVRLKRNATRSLDCNEELFFRVVKACFNKRRKTLRNSVRSAFGPVVPDFSFSHLRPEQLTVGQFIELTNLIGSKIEVSE